MYCDCLLDLTVSTFLMASTNEIKGSVHHINLVPVNCTVLYLFYPKVLYHILRGHLSFSQTQMSNPTITIE